MRFKTPVQDCFITSYFDEERNYKFAPKRIQRHEGIDYAPAYDDKREFSIYAAADGEILQVGWDKNGYGHFVVIKHNAQYNTLYAHLKKKSTLTVGEKVTTETVLGIMGSTGFSTGRHLHFVVQDMINGLNNYVYPKVVDPLPLMVSKIDTCEMSFSCYTVISRLIHI